MFENSSKNEKKISFSKKNIIFSTAHFFFKLLRFFFRMLKKNRYFHILTQENPEISKTRGTKVVSRSNEQLEAGYFFDESEKKKS
jgi:hypothetical protein